jgi:DNA-binding response OmpR family regulator
MRVLIVEDMVLVAYEIERILKKAECDIVGPISELDEALEIARGEALDGALLDVDLHGRDASPVAQVLRWRGIPYIIMTGYGPGAIPAELRSGPLLEKPFGSHELVTLAARVFRRQPPAGP